MKVINEVEANVEISEDSIERKTIVERAIAKGIEHLIYSHSLFLENYNGDKSKIRNRVDVNIANEITNGRKAYDFKLITYEKE